MKNKYFLLTLLLAATAIMATGCQKEEGTVTLGAEIQRPTNGKVYINDHTPCWHNGDEVYINNAAYAVIAATGSSAQIEEVTRHDTYRAIFPASIVASGSNISNSASVPVTLPAVQQYQMVGDHQRVDVPMGAYLTSGSTLHFYNLCSIVRVTVSNSLNQDLMLSHIMLQTEQARLSGSGTAVVNGSESSRINMATSAPHQVALNFTDDNPATVDALGTASFDIVVPEFATDNVTIHIVTTDGHFCETIKNNVGLVHNTITTVTVNVTELDTLPTYVANLIDGPAFNSRIPTSATHVIFEYGSPVSSGILLSTPDSPMRIYGNLNGTIWTVSTYASMIIADTNCFHMFYNKSNLTSITFGSSFNTENVTNMSGMFLECSSLTNLNLSNFNTENVTNMNDMFGQCRSLTSLNLSSFNTENVTNMCGMFDGDVSLTNLNLSSFNTENVMDMFGLFGYCRNLTSLNLSSFNTENVTNMGSMFEGCESLTSLNILNFNTENVTDMSNMFSGCGATSLDLSSFNTENVTDMSFMFSGCDATSLNLSSFNTENVTNMSGMFSCRHLTSLNLSSFNTENVTYMNGMFEECNILTSLNLSSFNTENVTDMTRMFYNCRSLTSLNLSHFDMMGITYKSEMCYNLSTTSGACTIICPLAVQTELQSGTSLPTSGVTFTWVRPTSK